MHSIMGWRTAAAHDTTWQGVEWDESKIEEDHEEGDLANQFYAKTDEYESRLTRLEGEMLRRGVAAGQRLDDMVVIPLKDPLAPTLQDRKGADALRDVNALMGRDQVQLRLITAVLTAQRPDGFALEDDLLPPRDSWALVTVHNLHRVYVRGDGRRYGSPAYNRRRLTRHFKVRGIEVRDVLLYIPARGDEVPDEVDFKMTVKATDAAIEWLRGTREVWFGDAESGTQTELWGTYTPKNAVWVPIEGVSLNQWVTTMRLAHPVKWNYPKVMQVIQRRLRASGWTCAGPVRGVGTRAGKNLQWEGPDATYAVLARTPEEAGIGAQLLSQANPAQVSEGRWPGKSRHVTRVYLETRLDAEDAEEEDDQGLLPMSLKPTWLSDWNILRVTRDAMETDNLSPSSLSEAILRKIWTEIPWTVGKLLRCRVKAGATGHWNKSWIVLLWAPADMFHMQAFAMAVNWTGSLEAMDTQKDPLRVEDHQGQPLVYFRYDFWVSKHAPLTASSGLVAVLQDARDPDFRAPVLQKEAWQQRQAASAQPETDTMINWKRGSLHPNFQAKKPDALTVKPGSFHPKAQRSEVLGAANLLMTVFQDRRIGWIPSATYNHEEADPTAEELTTSTHVDLRKLSWQYPQLAPLFNQRALLYEAVTQCLACGDLKQEAKDGGLVLTRVRDLPKLPAGGMGTAPVVSTAPRTSGGWGRRDNSSVALVTRLPPRFNPGPPTGPEGGAHGRQ